MPNRSYGDQKCCQKTPSTLFAMGQSSMAVRHSLFRRFRGALMA